MGIIRKDFKYKKIEKFLTEDEVYLLRHYAIMKHRVNKTNFDAVKNNNAETYFYGDPLTDSLLLKKIPLMEKETGLQLYPTYSFWRMYTKYAKLGKHIDRPACEISVTVMLGADEESNSWPIYIDGTPIYMKQGDAAIYLGCESMHWREEFNGDWHAQCFLHYVDKNGPNKDQIRDGRPIFGMGGDPTSDF
jgi:hypothetical protein